MINKNYLKRKEYNDVKMHKYVPLLEKQVGKEIRSRQLWMETALDISEEAVKEKRKSTGLLIFLMGIAVTLTIETFMLIRYLVGV